MGLYDEIKQTSQEVVNKKSVRMTEGNITSKTGTNSYTIKLKDGRVLKSVRGNSDYKVNDPVMVSASRNDQKFVIVGRGNRKISSTKEVGV